MTLLDVKRFNELISKFDATSLERVNEMKQRDKLNLVYVLNLMNIRSIYDIFN
jgi:hypothetical protein